MTQLKTTNSMIYLWKLRYRSSNLLSEKNLEILYSEKLCILFTKIIQYQQNMHMTTTLYIKNNKKFAIEKYL